MHKIMVDAETAAAIEAHEVVAELIGPDGRTLGGFVPPAYLHDVRWMWAERKRMYDEAWKDFSEEDLYAADEGEAIPHEEVMKRLGLE